MLVRLAACSLLLVGCVPDSTEDPGPLPVAHQLDLAKLSPGARARVIRASLTDLSAAGWLARELRFTHAPCMTTTQTGGTVTIAAQDCNGFSGALDVIDQDTYQFHAVRLADQDLELDGTLVELFSPTSFYEGVDLTIKREGVAVHSIYNTVQDGFQPGASLEVDGDSVQLTRAGNAVTFTSLDPAIAPLTFTLEGACGADPISGDPICLWNTEPAVFATGTFRKLERVCAGSDARLRFTSASDAPLTAYVDGVHISIGTGTRDPATNLYAFETSDGDCDQPSTISTYYVSQSSAYRAELMIAPHLVWSIEP